MLEALQLLVPLFYVIPQVMTMMGPSPMFMSYSKMTAYELQLLHIFSLNLQPNFHDKTICDHMNRAFSELAKLVQSGVTADHTKLPFSQVATYEDIREIIYDKIINNHELLSQSALFSMINPSFLPSQQPVSFIPPSNDFESLVPCQMMLQCAEFNPVSPIV